METLFASALVGIATLVSLFAALGLQALFLRATFWLMQPATAQRRTTPIRPRIERGTQLAAGAYARQH